MIEEVPEILEINNQNNSNNAIIVNLKLLFKIGYICGPAVAFLPQILSNNVIYGPLLSILAILTSILKIFSYLNIKYSDTVLFQNIFNILIHLLILKMNKTKSFVFPYFNYNIRNITDNTDRGTMNNNNNTTDGTRNNREETRDSSNQLNININSTSQSINHVYLKRRKTLKYLNLMFILTSSSICLFGLISIFEYGFLFDPFSSLIDCTITYLQYIFYHDDPNKPLEVFIVGFFGTCFKLILSLTIYKIPAYFILSLIFQLVFDILILRSSYKNSVEYINTL